MGCTDDRKKKPCKQKLSPPGGLMLPASVKDEDISYIGHKVRTIPAEYNAAFVEISPTAEHDAGKRGWLISILGNPIFISEEDMRDHFEIVREMDVPLEDELTSKEKP